MDSRVWLHTGALWRVPGWCAGWQQPGAEGTTVPHCHACLHYWCSIFSTQLHVAWCLSKTSMVAVAGVYKFSTLECRGHEGKSHSSVRPCCFPLHSAPCPPQPVGRSSHCPAVGSDGVFASARSALLRDCLCQTRHCSSPKQKNEEQKTAGGCCRLMLILN